MSSGLAAPSPDDRVRISDPGRRAGGHVQRPGLGVGAIVGDTFAIFFGRIHWFVLLAFIPLVTIQLIVVAILGGLSVYRGGLLESLDPSDVAVQSSFVAIFAVAAVLGSVMFVVTLGFTVLAAYDAKLGRPFRLGSYLAGGLRPIVPLVVCSIVVIALIYVASIALLIPGLWVMSAFSVVVPAIVIEGAGLGALGRSATLTKGYRWPVLGALILIGICTIVLAVAVALLIAGAEFMLAPVTAMLGPVAGVLGSFLQSLEMSVSFGLTYVGVALIYARLREIKEGTSVETLAEVFA